MALEALQWYLDLASEQWGVALSARAAALHGRLCGMTPVVTSSYRYTSSTELAAPQLRSICRGRNPHYRAGLQVAARPKQLRG